MAKGSAVGNKIKSGVITGIGIAIGGIVVGFVLAQLAKRGISIPGA